MATIRVLHDYTKDVWPGLIGPNLLDPDSSNLENGPGIWVGDGTHRTPGGGNLGISFNYLGRVTGNARSGSYSIALTNPGDDPYPFLSSNLVPITVGKLYYLVGYARTRGGVASEFTIEAELYNGDADPALLRFESMNYPMDIDDSQWHKMEFVFFVEYGLRFNLVNGETYRGPPQFASFDLESLGDGLPAGCILDFDDFALYETKFRPAGVNTDEGTELQQWDGYDELQISSENFSTYGVKRNKLITTQAFSYPAVGVLDLKTNEYDNLHTSLPNGGYNTLVPEGSALFGGTTLSSRDGNGYFAHSTINTIHTPNPPFGYARAQNYADMPIHKIDVDGNLSLLAVWRFVAPGQEPFLGNIPYVTGPSSVAWNASITCQGGCQGPPGDDALYVGYRALYRVDLVGAFTATYQIANGVLRVEQDGTVTDLPELLQVQYLIDGHTNFIDESYWGCTASANPAGTGPTVVTVVVSKYDGYFLNNDRPVYLKSAEVGSGVPARTVAKSPLGTFFVAIAPDWNRRDIITSLTFTDFSLQRTSWITRYVWGGTFAEGIAQSEVIAGRIEDGVSPPIRSGPIHELLPLVTAVQALSPGRYAFAVRDDSSGGPGINRNPPLMQIWGRGVTHVLGLDQRVNEGIPVMRQEDVMLATIPFSGAPPEPGTTALDANAVLAHEQRIHTIKNRRRGFS